MQLVFERDVILPKLEKLQKITSGHTQMPILNFILIQTNEDNKVMIIGNNLEIALGVASSANIIKPGIAAIPSRKFYEMVREMPAKATFTFTHDDNFNVKIQYSQGNYRLKGRDPEEFPRVIEIKEVNNKLEGKVLLGLLESTLFAASRDNVNHSMNGIKFDIESELITAAAADTRRIAIGQKELKADLETEPNSFLVPTQSAYELQNMFMTSKEVYYSVTEKQLIVTDQDSFLTTRLIEVEFPPYRRVIDIVHDKKIYVNKESLIKGIRRVDLMADHNTYSMLFIIKGDTVTLQVKTPDVGEANTLVNLNEAYENEPTVFRFHSKVLMEGLAQMKTEDVQLVFNEPQQHVYVYPDEGSKSDVSYFNLVMPLVLDDTEVQIVLAAIEEEDPVGQLSVFDEVEKQEEPEPEPEPKVEQEEMPF